MKGFAMTAPNKVEWIEKETPKLGPRDAIIKPTALAPCSSDIHTVWEGGLDLQGDIRILGHEAIGIVDAVGSEVKDFKPGDRVIVPAITPNWSAKASQCGFHQHADCLLGGYQFTFVRDGTMSEYFLVNDADANLAIQPDDMSDEAALMITDMVTTGFSGAENANIKIGDNVAVIGIGPVGLCAVAGARLRGAGRLFAVGSRPDCANIAKKYGATDIINYKKGDIVEQILAETDGIGVDAVVVAGGNAATFAQGIQMAKPGSTISNINYFGIQNYEGAGDILPIPRDAWGAGMAHKTITGGLCPGGRVRMEQLVNVVESGRMDPGLLITHTFKGLEKVEDSLFLMKDKPRDLIKPMVKV
ncbi:MAG: NAD(P)-dependent alcohol dehydrogenase [Methanobacterium paludis]|nr:NAD(P)-dependent alcohol dehydrogenase [Methanobacterium paludis]